MKIAVISDTHGEHERLHVPDADTVIHCGDFCTSGQPADARFFLRWFCRLPHRNKILIAGNHDLCMEKHSRLMRAEMPANIHYLEDSGVEIDGHYFWGSPVTPEFFNWAFNRKRGEEIAKHWAAIPAKTDVLITHGPPAGILDGGAVLKIADGAFQEPIGDLDLLFRVHEVRPYFHCFGHVHRGYGQRGVRSTHFVNAAICNEAYRPVNAPVIIELG